MEIRKTNIEELDKVMQIYQRARHFMAEHGNPTQWGNSKPSKEQIEQDILTQKSYVCVDDGELVGVFYFAKEEDPTYQKIEYGKWLNTNPYAVVHRIASAGIVKGVGAFCLEWAMKHTENLRIDTHKDNIVMQNMLKKCGFVHCGTIYLEDGEQRMAFHKIKNKKESGENNGSKKS